MAEKKSNKVINEDEVTIVESLMKAQELLQIEKERLEEKVRDLDDELETAKCNIESIKEVLVNFDVF